MEILFRGFHKQADGPDAECSFYDVPPEGVANV